MCPEIPLQVLEEYFGRVQVEQSGACLLWPSNCLNGSGYGQLEVRLKKYGGRQRFLAHRLAYRIAYGAVPEGLQVLHSCDVKRCVNPEHLSVGTQLENEAGKVARGRSNRGDQRWCATLSNRQAQELLDKYRSGVGIVKLAKAYQVTYGVAYSICKRKRWKYLI